MASVSINQLELLYVHNNIQTIYKKVLNGRHINAKAITKLQRKIEKIFQHQDLSEQLESLKEKVVLLKDIEPIKERIEGLYQKCFERRFLPTKSQQSLFVKVEDAILRYERKEDFWKQCITSSRDLFSSQNEIFILALSFLMIHDLIRSQRYVESLTDTDLKAVYYLILENYYLHEGDLEKAKKLAIDKYKTKDVNFLMIRICDQLIKSSIDLYLKNGEIAFAMHCAQKSRFQEKSYQKQIQEAFSVR